MTYPRLVRPVLFRRDAEAAHEWTLRRLAALSRRPAALAPLRQLYARSAPRTVFGVRFPTPVGLAGGLSGRPLAPRAREVVTFVSKRSELPVIGVGGILTPEDAWRLFDAGASLVQLYTGLVYAGPALVRRIVRGLR